MKKKRVISFLLGLVSSIPVLVTNCFIYLLVTNYHSGWETLQQIENKRYMVLLFSIIFSLVAAIIVIIILVKKKRKYVAFGVTPFTIIFLIWIILYYIGNLSHLTQFNKTDWNKDHGKPFDMAASLVKGNVLIGKTHQEIKAMLGQGFLENGNDKTEKGSIQYYIENNWEMIVGFHYDKVVDAELIWPPDIF
jgi:hypothetical protein